MNAIFLNTNKSDTYVTFLEITIIKCSVIDTLSCNNYDTVTILVINNVPIDFGSDEI